MIVDMPFRRRIMNAHRVAALTGSILLAVFASGDVQGQVSASQRSSAQLAYKEGVRLVEESGVRRLDDKSSYELGINRLEHALKLDPTFIDAYMALAKAYWNYQLFFPDSDAKRAESREKSLALYRKVIDIKPDFADAYAQLSIVGGQNEEERVALLKKALALNPQHNWARAALARVLLSRGSFHEAAQQYRTHMEVSTYGGIQDAHNHAAFASSLANEGQLREAVEIYETMLKLAESERQFHRCILVRDIDVDKFKEYEDFTNTVRKLRPYCTALGHYNKAVQLIGEQKYDEAIQELRLQLAENPYPDGTYIALEDIYNKRGQPGKALEVVKSYLKIQKEPIERCRFFNRLNIRTYEKLDSKFIDQLRKECDKYAG